jgi:hypothetical protein
LANNIWLDFHTQLHCIQNNAESSYDKYTLSRRAQVKYDATHSFVEGRFLALSEYDIKGKTLGILLGLILFQPNLPSPPPYPSKLMYGTFSMKSHWP